MSLGKHQSSRPKSMTWLTPPEWIKALGHFDLDPCCPKNMPWDTAGAMNCEDDGLSFEWWGKVWLNPPFGNQAAKWMRKMARHNNGIALLAARTETKMFFESVWPVASGICFVKGRPHFYTGRGKRAPFNSGAPIVLIAYGNKCLRQLESSGLGKTIRLKE